VKRKKMPEFDFSGAFVNVDNVDDEDILTVVAVPTPEEKESAQQKELINGVLKPKRYMVLNMPVELNGSNKTYTPDPKTGLRFQAAWGKDYSKLVGKQFSVKIEAYKAFGADKERVSGYPLEEKH
jgi:hypothetical protein